MPDDQRFLVEVDLTEPVIATAMKVLDHIEAALALVNKNDQEFSLLASAKHKVELRLGAMLHNRVRALAKKADSPEVTE